MDITILAACGHEKTVTIFPHLPTEPQRQEAMLRPCRACARAAHTGFTMPTTPATATPTPAPAAAPAPRRSTGTCITCGDPTDAPHHRYCTECYDPGSVARYHRATGRAVRYARYDGSY